VGAGIHSASGIKKLAGWDLVVAVDQTDAEGDGGGYSDLLVPLIPFQGQPTKQNEKLKTNVVLLPNVLGQRNRIVTANAAGDDGLGRKTFIRDQKGNQISQPITTDNLIGICATDYLNLGYALEDLVPKYRGRKNTAIVLGSEFQWNANHFPPEELEWLRQTMLDAQMPVFLISLGATPDKEFVKMAEATGGGYLGYLSAQTAKSLARNPDKVWVCEGGATAHYIRGETPETVASTDILPGLGESPISVEEAQKRSDAAQAGGAGEKPNPEPETKPETKPDETETKTETKPEETVTRTPVSPGRQGQ
jgi:hypothetical protein